MLTDILRTMLAASGSTHRLERGLALAYSQRANAHVLSLSRIGARPGEDEIAIVLRHLANLGQDTRHVQRESATQFDGQGRLHFITRLSWPIAVQVDMFAGDSLL